MFEKMLFPVTFDLDFEEIVRNMEPLKKLNIQNINLLHVVPSPLKNNNASLQAALQTTVQTIKEKGGFNVSQAQLTAGHPASLVVDTAKKDSYHLIFVPAENKNLMTRSILGSTTDDLIRITDTPTLVYKNYLAKPMKWKTVVFATDFAVAATGALPYVKFIGRAAQDLLILHVGTRAADPHAENKRIESINKKLEDLKMDLSPHWQKVDTFAELGNHTGKIRSIVKKYNADLLIIGKGNASFKKKLLGSTAEKVSHSVKASVLLIP